MSKPRKIENYFKDGVDGRWNQIVCGGGKVTISNGVLRMGYKSAQSDSYSDAQIDDHTMLSRKKFPWRAPLEMTVKARFVFSRSKNIGKSGFQGTAGFGFWNNPFSPNGEIHSLPESIWFFYASSNSHMLLCPSGTGYGWKAQVIHSYKWSGLIYFIPTSIAVLISRYLHNNSSLKWIERFSGVQEKLLNDNLSSWHIYKIQWEKTFANFYIDNKLVLTVQQPPTQPLGFVAWVDNQYSTVSPGGEVKFGKCESKELILEVAYIKIRPS